MPTPDAVIDRLCAAARDPVNHRYPESEGLPELRRAMASWYGKRFHVELNPDTEILPLIGSKEGIGHAAWCYLDPGDIALIPDPAYPVYSVSTMLAGGKPHFLPLKEENAFLPDLDNIPGEVLKQAKVLWINYPNNPTGAVAEPGLFEKAVALARANNIAICHDGPYSEVSFDGYQPHSILETEGAKEVGIEFILCQKATI